MDQLLKDTPVFSHGHLVARAQQLEVPLGPRSIKSLLSCWRATGRVQDIRRGLYASLEAPPPSIAQLPVLAAGLSRPDSIIAYQTALYHHLDLPQPSKLIVIAGTHLPWELDLPGRTYTCTPVRLDKAIRVTWDVTTLDCGWGPSIRLTGLERSFVDALDRSDLLKDQAELKGLWQAMEQPSSIARLAAMDLDKVVHYLDLLGCATTRAKVGYFLEGHWKVFGISPCFLDRLTPPKGPVRWDRATPGGHYSRRWNLVVPAALAELPCGSPSTGDHNPAIAPSHLRNTLRETFGYGGFRDGQEEVIRAVLEGRDALAILPTGAGKSLTYQLPAVLLGGLTLVISPLVALMLDQVQEASSFGIAARSLTASNTLDERDETFAMIQSGSLSLLFVAPESLQGLMRPLMGLRPQLRLIVVDEAHCIHDWGKTFRPSYRNLGRLKASLSLPVLALTASANDAVQRDIKNVLGLEAPFVQQVSCLRENLYISHRQRSRRFWRDILHDVIQNAAGTPGIVYCQRKTQADQVARWLQKEGFTAEAYHAEVQAADRLRIQNAFKENHLQIVVATSAFGMGVNKPDIRWILHMGVPHSLSDYAQQIGRAGRDGKPATCLLLYSPREFAYLRGLAANEKAPSSRTLRVQQTEEVTAYLKSRRCRHQELAEHFGERIPTCKRSSTSGGCDVCTPHIGPRGQLDQGDHQTGFEAIIRVGRRVGQIVH